MKSTKYQLLEADFLFLNRETRQHIEMIERLQKENETLKQEKEVLQKENESAIQLSVKYEDALREIDTRIRATGQPVPYIVETLKKALPEYRDSK